MRNHVEQHAPPPGTNLNVTLDQYRGWHVVEEQRRPALGQVQPIYERGDRTWVDWFTALDPRRVGFLALRERRDPNNVFLTSYRRDRFGLWDAPPPAPR